MSWVRRDSVFMILVGLLALVARLLPTPRTIDDAFITFRYSRNLVEGLGFVYNPGVQTLGTTTPLYTLLMALISTITGGQDFPWYALTVNALADSVTAALLLWLAWRLTGSLGAGVLAGVLWALSPASVTFAVGGMETSLNLLWMMAAFACFIAGRGVWMGVFVALAFLTRIDTVILTGPLLLWHLVEHWRARADQPLIERVPWRVWLAGGLVALPWLLFAWVYFGSPVPNSIAAKTVAYVLPPGTAFVEMFRTYIVPFSEFQLVGSVGVMVLTVIYSTLVIVGLLYVARNQPRFLPLLVYPWVYMLLFSLANPLIFRWYRMPPLPALMLTLIAGAWAIIHAVESSRPAWPVRRVGLAGLALFWGAATLSGWQLQPDHGPQRPAPEMAWHQIELYYEQIGRQLRDDYGVTAETPVASGDIGAVGYFSRARIIDTVGLVTPEMRAYYPADPALIVPEQNYAIPPRLILDTQPDYLVTMEAFVRLGLEQEAEFQRDYRLLVEIPTDFYGTGMRLYGRDS